MGKMSLTSCRALSTPGKFSNVDRYDVSQLVWSTESILLLAVWYSASQIAIVQLLLY